MEYSGTPLELMDANCQRRVVDSAECSRRKCKSPITLLVPLPRTKFGDLPDLGCGRAVSSQNCWIRICYVTWLQRLVNELNYH
jgi:hypothetical protein